MLRTVVFLLMLALLAVNVAATDVVVLGTIYYSDGITEVAEADISVECDGETRTTTSDADGDYSVDFTGTDCDIGDPATVTASKDGASGSASDTVEDYTYIQLAIVNVSIPEFGTMTAGIALLGAAAVYFWRKKK